MNPPNLPATDEDLSRYLDTLSVEVPSALRELVRRASPEDLQRVITAFREAERTARLSVRGGEPLAHIPRHETRVMEILPEIEMYLIAAKRAAETKEAES